MANLSNLIKSNSSYSRVDTEDTLSNKTLEDPTITVNGQTGSSKQVITTDGDGNVLFAGADGLRLPAGTTGERPSNPAIGEIRYNTDESAIEKYDGSSWSPILGATDDLDISSLSVAGNPVVDSNRVLRNVKGVNNILRKPKNLGPSNQDTDVGNLLTDIDLSGTGFGSLFGGQGGAQFQISETSDFSTTVIDRNLPGGSINSVNLNLVQKELEENTTYYWRVRYYDSNNNFSLFSDPTEFTTASTFAGVDAPTITDPVDGDTEIGETPTITTSTFSVTGTTDTHESTDWQIATDSAFTDVIYESLDDTSNLESITVPAGNLQEGETTYYVRARHTGVSTGDSVYSNAVSFTTTNEFFNPNIGDPVEGGFFAGYVVSDVDSQLYAIIVSDGNGDTYLTGAGERRWRENQTALTEAQTLADGKSVMDHIVNNETLSDFPIFEWIENNLNSGSGLNGYTDWYLPARDELELIYRHFKPRTENNDTRSRPSGPEFGADGATVGTNNSSDPNGSGYTTSDPSQTSITSFQDGNADYLVDDSFYWSSTEYDDSESWAQYFYFDPGRQFTSSKDGQGYVRAVRRIQIS